MRRFRNINVGLVFGLLVVALLSLVPLGARSPVSANGATLASSTFDTGNEGWKKVSLADYGPYDSLNADFGAADYKSSGGNPGGHIGTDDLDNWLMWFEAPGKFLGDKSGAYGGALSYDLKVSGVADRTSIDVALLVGGGMILVYGNTRNPETNWTHFDVSLKETAGWKKTSSSGSAPTQAEFKSVMSNLKVLRIRGEFLQTLEYDRLDNVIMAGAGAAVATPAPSGGAVLASSTFDSGNEGWKKVSHKGGGPYDSVIEDFGPADYQSSGGNPGGHIFTPDEDDWCMYFQAPARFLGDKSAAYGGTLSFDIKPQATPNISRPDVVLVGAGLVLVYDTADPKTTWTHFDVSLKETAGWKKTSSSGSSPTQAEFRSVLGKLTALRIRGEFISGVSDTNHLDNVIMTGTGAAPAPVATLTVVPPPPPPPGGGTRVSYKAGWNIVAGPGGTTFSQANRMLYTSQGSGGYDVLINSQGVTEGWGYWAYFASDTTMTMSGTGSSSYTTTLDAGQMKMVGNPSGVKSATATADKIYLYDPVSGYSMKFGSATLPVGVGAWVFSAAGGTVTVTAQ